MFNKTIGQEIDRIRFRFFTKFPQNIMLKYPIYVATCTCLRCNSIYYTSSLETALILPKTPICSINAKFESQPHHLEPF